MTTTHYDLIIVGGGPIGIACGLEAQKAGLSYLILEKGCLVNSLYNYPANMTFFSTSERIEIGEIPFVSNNVKPVRSEALEYYRRVSVSHRLNIHLQEEVKEIHPAKAAKAASTDPTQNTVSSAMTKAAATSHPEPAKVNAEPAKPNPAFFATSHPASAARHSESVAPHTASPANPDPAPSATAHSFEVITSRRSYSAAHIVLATGFYDLPVLLDIPGESLPKVTHYYKEPHFYAMQKVVVVGASNSSVDAALETWRKGAEVTMVIRGEGIGSRVKYWVKPDIENRIKEGSIKAYTHSSLLAIRENEVDIQTPEGTLTLPNDYVIALTGYQPNFDFLRRAGIQLSDDGKLQPFYNPETMETNVKNLYLAGVVCGGMNTHVWFIENSRVHAVMILEDIIRKRAHAAALESAIHAGNTTMTS